MIKHDFSYFSTKIWFGYSKELSQRNGSFKHQNMFELMGNEIMTILGFYLPMLSADNLILQTVRTQIRQNIGPDLDSNCWTLMVFLK